MPGRFTEVHGWQADFVVASDSSEEAVTRVLRELTEDYRDPPVTVDDVLETLRRAGVPRFVEDVRRYL